MFIDCNIKSAEDDLVTYNETNCGNSGVNTLCTIANHTVAKRKPTMAPTTTCPVVW